MGVCFQEAQGQNTEWAVPVLRPAANMGLRLTEHLRAWPSARSEVPPVPEPPRFQGNQVSICCPFQISMRCSGPCPQRWQAWAKIVRVVGSIRPHLPGGSSPRLVLHFDLTPAGTSTSAYCNRKIHTQRDSAQNKKTAIQANQHTEVNSWSVIMPWPTSEPPSQGPGAWASPGKNSAGIRRKSNKNPCPCAK